VAGVFDSEAFETLKRHIESLGLNEKQKGKFIMEEWWRMLEAEESKKLK